MNGKSLARCIYDCKDDSACEADCVGHFKIQTDDCPCEVWLINYIYLLHKGFMYEAGIGFVT